MSDFLTDLKALCDFDGANAGQDDATILAWLNDDTAVTYDRERIPLSEAGDIISANHAEFLALPANNRTLWDMVSGLNPDGLPTSVGNPTRTLLAQEIFTTGDAPNIRAALIAAIPATKSRAVSQSTGMKLSSTWGFWTSRGDSSGNCHGSSVKPRSKATSLRIKGEVKRSGCEAKSQPYRPLVQRNSPLTGASGLDWA